MTIKLTIPLSQIGASQGASDGIIIELTPEQEEQIARQRLDPAVNEPEPDICQHINSWEDAQEIVQAKYYLNPLGFIGCYKHPEKVDMLTKAEKSNVPSERQAKSMLAFAQLSVIAEAYNSTATIGSEDFSIIPEPGNTNRLCVASTGYTCTRMQIRFAQEDHAINCLKKFEQLWEDYWMI